MEVDLIPERTCSVRIGSVTIDGFRVESEWHGFVKIVHATKGYLIVTRSDGFAELTREMFESIFGKQGDFARRVVVMQGTRELLIEIGEAEERIRKAEAMRDLLHPASKEPVTK